MHPLGISDITERRKIYFLTCKAARAKRMMECQIRAGVLMKSSGGYSSCSSSISQNGSNGDQEGFYTLSTPDTMFAAIMMIKHAYDQFEEDDQCLGSIVSFAAIMMIKHAYDQVEEDDQCLRSIVSAFASEQIFFVRLMAFMLPIHTLYWIINPNIRMSERREKKLQLLLQKELTSSDVGLPKEKYVNVYLINCDASLCKHCNTADLNGDHKLLQNYRLVYQDTIRIADMEPHIDCSKIQRIQIGFFNMRKRSSF